jgi:phenylpropionate dioxygenase-like ring-hydroxylating dioxygenase large terminal subunit
MGQFARNHWYPATWARDLSDAPLGRRMLGEPVVLFRKKDGGIAALTDRCPHRLVPLSMGVLVERGIRCGYHGIEFDASGRCVYVPSQDSIPPTAQVRSYPVAERYGLVWVWMGDAKLADPALLPAIEKYGAPGWELIDGGYQHHPSNYMNIVENLMDPAHTTFVHRLTIGNPAASTEPVKMERTDNHIVAYKWLLNSQPSPFDKQIMDFQGKAVDRGQFFYYHVPGMSRVDICTMPAGLEHTEENMDLGLRNNSYKFLTPETESATHFFWLHLRNYKVGDLEWSEKMRANLEKTFLEDREIEMAMQRSQDELGVRQLTGLQIDRAPGAALRMIEKLIQSEQEAAL